MQLTAQGGIPRDISLKILLWASKRFKVSREIEDLIEQQPQEQQQEQQAPSKEQINIIELQQKNQIDQQKMAVESARLDQEHKLKWAELELEQRELDQKKQEMLLKAQVGFSRA